MTSVGQGRGPSRQPKPVEFVAKMVTPPNWRLPKDKLAREIEIDELFDPIRQKLDQELSPRGPLLGYDVEPKSQRVTVRALAHEAAHVARLLTAIGGLRDLRQAAALELD